MCSYVFLRTVPVMPPAAPTDPPWLNLAQAANHLSCSPDWLKRLAAKGEVVAYKTSDSPRGRWRFRPADLDAYIERHRQGVPTRRRSRKVPA